MLTKYPSEIPRSFLTAFTAFGFVLCRYAAIALGFAKEMSSERWRRGSDRTGGRSEGEHAAGERCSTHTYTHTHT